MKAAEFVSRYQVDIQPIPKEDGGGYQAVFPQLGRMLVGYGLTREEALEDLTASVPTLIASFEEAADKFPEPEVPSPWQDFSGRVTLRLPKSLHAQLDRLAEKEGVSLNTLMLTALQTAATAMAAGIEFGAIPTHQAPHIKKAV